MGILERGRGGTIARQLLVFQVLLSVVLGIVAAAISYAQARSQVLADARDRSLAVTVALADSGAVPAALAQPDPTAVLQRRTVAMQHATGIDFVVVMYPDGIRITHPDADRIGREFSGPITRAVAGGQTYTETKVGTLGLEVRAVVPVHNDSGKIVAAVSSGVLIHNVQAETWRRLPAILTLSGVAAGVGALGAVFISRRVRRQTFGLEPAEITRMYEHDQAVLHAIREGVVVADTDGRLVLVNDEARRLLDLATAPEATGAEQVGRTPDGLSVRDLPGTVRRILDSEPDAHDTVTVVGDRTVVVNRRTTTSRGRSAGWVSTLRDQTELDQLTRNLSTVQAFADTLRAQAHETANRWHALLGLIRLRRFDEAADLVAREHAASTLLSNVSPAGGGDPTLAAIVLAKSAQARERAIDLRVAVDTVRLDPDAVVTILGNLLDNAFDAVAGLESPVVSLSVTATETGTVIAVEDSGPGLTPEAREHCFDSRWSTKQGTTTGRGLGLAIVRATVARLGGSVQADNDTPLGGARFTVELP
jgi:two-component system, CitB family, sensor kinase